MPRHPALSTRLWELTRLFAKLGAVSFGGPAAYIAIMEQEVVEQRAWLSRRDFLDLVGTTYLIPGPNAVEMAAHLGYQRAGALGSLAAGLSFTLPAVVISLVLGWAYLSFGTLPAVEPFLYGIKPVVLGIIFAAVWRLGRAGWKNWQTLVVGLAAAAAVLAGCDEVLTLLAGTLLGAVLLRLTSPSPPQEPKSDDRAPSACAGVIGLSAPVSAGALGSTAGAAATTAAATGGVALWKLALFFLKVGVVWYGGGYVLVAYMEGGLVRDYRWLTHQQLLDAVAIGQITPGPMLSTVTFVGYLLGGVPGGLVSTGAILLPSFVIVAAANPWIPRLRRWSWTARLLDAVSAAAVGLTAAVLVTLGYGILLASGQPGQGVLLRLTAWGLAAGSAAVMLRFKLSPIWLILGGAAAGRLMWLL